MSVSLPSQRVADAVAAGPYGVELEQEYQKVYAPRSLIGPTADMTNQHGAHLRIVTEDYPEVCTCPVAV